MPLIGVLSLQGAVQPHKRHIEAAGADFLAVKTPTQFEKVDALILPGGESTTMLKLIDTFGLEDALVETFSRVPVWGICAGAILMAETVYKSAIPAQAGISAAGGPRLRGGCRQGEQKSFGLLPITVTRNAYGRQLESHEIIVNGAPVSYIRAPIIEDAGDCEVLAEHQGKAVWVRKGQYMATTFHAELSPDAPSEMHRAFINSVRP